MRTVEDLYRAHARYVLAYALRRTDAATADDVVPEVFLIVERRLGDVPADARPWLYGVARRVLANQRHSDGRRAALHAALGVLARGGATVPPPEFDADTPLLAALAALRPDDQEVLMLTAWEGMDAQDAATVLGCSTAALHTGKLTPLGPNRLKVDLPGRSDNDGDFTAYYDIDPKTALPVRYVTTQPGGSTTTVQFRVYETLPFNATTRAQLRLRDHPAPASLSTTAQDHFAVLRRGGPPTGQLGAAVKRVTQSRIPGSRQLDARTARRLAPGIALIPSDDGVCLITVQTSGTGIGCAGLTRVLERGLGTGVPNPAPLPKSAGVAGLRAGVDLAVPDGVIAVKTRFHGRWTRRPVHGNFIRLPRFSGQYVLIKR